MRVTGDQINSITPSSQMRPAVCEAVANDTPKANEPTSVCRALISLSPVRSSERTQTIARQPANFLAHLIATQQAIPQTRERRRVEPNVAAACYAAARDTLAAADHEVTHAL